MMQIGEVARALGVTTRTIRHYESLGLIQPHSTSESGYRLYTEREVVMLDHILVLRKLGFPLQEIKRLLDRLNEAEMPESEQVRALIRRQMQVIEREISQLEEVRSALGQIDFSLELNAGQPLRFVKSIAQTMGRNAEARRRWRDIWDFDGWAKGYDHSVQHAQVKGHSVHTERYNPHENYDKVLDLVAELIGGEKTVLEIGIGTGNLAARLLTRGCAVLGVDQSREMLRQARAKLRNATLFQGNFLALPLEDASVDAVATTYALHHLKEEEKRLAVAEMVRVARPGGHIVIGDNMFVDPAARQLERERLFSAGLQQVWNEIENEYLGDVSNFARWFAEHGRVLKARQMARYTFVLWID